MSTDDRPDTTPESQWYTIQPGDPAPPHELMISPARAVEEVIASLGNNATAEQVQSCLLKRGIQLDPETIHRVLAECHPHCARA